MAYQSDTIATVINRLNIQYFLPAIQREFVWTPDQIVQLFDSLMRGYPISTFLFWQLKPENRDKWEIYKFLDVFDARDAHNPPAATNGVQQLSLVLDGQQRLTSLMIGLKGAYIVRRKYNKWNSPNAWSKQYLYLDLFQDPATSEDAETGIHYGFAFMEQASVNNLGKHWFKVGTILDFDSEDNFDNFLNEAAEQVPDSATIKQRNLLVNNLRRLRETVWKKDVISYYTEHNQDYDRVLDIFVRANDGGTKLSKSDLLLSMVTSKWTQINARKDIYDFVDHLNNGLASKNNFDKDFVLKTCLVVSDLPVTYKVSSFTNENLDLIQNKWSKIKIAIESCVRLANSYGIDRDTLSSANALIPIIYYLFRLDGKTLVGSTSFDVKNASLVRRWLIMALLNPIFGSLGDNVQREARKVLQEHLQHSEDFPAEAINAALARTGKSANFDAYDVERFLCTEYRSRTSLLALSLLYDENSWGTLHFHQDHIFPKSLFTTERLTEAGLSVEEQTRYKTLMNRVGTLNYYLMWKTSKSRTKISGSGLPHETRVLENVTSSQKTTICCIWNISRSS